MAKGEVSIKQNTVLINLIMFKEIVNNELKITKNNLILQKTTEKTKYLRAKVSKNKVLIHIAHAKKN